MKFVQILAGSTLAILISCNNPHDAAPGSRTTFFDKSGMDTTIKPGDDFFLYANGKWERTTVIPGDQGGAGSFYDLYESNIAAQKALLEQAAQADHAKGNLEQKVGDFYASGMDTAAIEKIAGSPLTPVLAKISAVKDYKELVTLLGELAAADETDLFGFYVSADDKNSSKNIAVLSQAGTSLPERDYYFRKDSTASAARTGLLKYAQTLFQLSGTDTATAIKNAQQVLSIETQFATAHRTPVELRDPKKNYNKLSVTQLAAVSPNIDWKTVFTKMGVKTDSVNVKQPDYFKAFSDMLVSQPVDVWKSKLAFDYISGNAGLLSKAFVNAGFDFSKIFSGRQKQPERWKKMVNAVDEGLGELLGQLYVKKYFTPEAKQRMDELVNNLQKAFEARIKKLDWMSDSTKQKALVKLNSFLKKIGYTSKWDTYEDVTISRNDYFANVKSTELHRYKKAVKKIDQPVDKTDWDMTPPTVNAYYNASNNEIVFPAGILQFPFFDVNADDAINYGGIGMVIGHEMTHGFDDEGSQYDDRGNLKNWWLPTDSAKFKTKTSSVVKQYSAYTMFDSLHLNGDLTLGENLADIGGLAIAYDAFKMTQQGQSNELIDGFTPDQRFFLGYAQVWRMKNTEASARSRITSDPHSPEAYRVNGPAANFDPFYKAFNVKEGDKLYIKPENRVTIW